MVWALLPAGPSSVEEEDKYYIFKKGTYKVGRKGCDIIIHKDKGVSRIHAHIIVDEMTKSSQVRIKDLSKYGTFINKNLTSNKKVHQFPNKQTSLEDGDLISFGTGNANYRFSYVPLVFYICCDEASQMNHHLQDKVSSIGARLTHVFGEECTHVLIDQHVPLQRDLLDAIVAKKPVLHSNWLEYNFGDRLQSLLEVSGSRTILVDDICSSSQVFECGENICLTYVIPGRSSDKFDHLDRLSLSYRVSEMALIRAVLSGNLVQSILIPSSVLVSSSCSTDETVVADSDEENEAATPVNANAAIHKEVAQTYVSSAEISMEAPNCVSKAEVSTYHDATRSESQVTFKDDNCCLIARRNKADKSEDGSSNIVYSQDLIVRDVNITSTSSYRTDNGVINYKRFRKASIQSGNSFNNLVPFSKYPHKNFEFGSGEMAESVNEEKKRKKIEAIAEDMFNNEKGRQRGFSGSLRRLHTRG
ncbi:nijmegen breakage syndrome 1 protein isoform X2 [Durio zibethinus]|uniref:Nijmegen breakage syndrome 1 protein isoform X2 n=1 Tax=Durio zibethinus TaxID=66656 RepID=A0A6P6A3U2_DURZI|nr:nijmegen breakage syndrome 1 protein isoform X2 [Durio zibethinus]